MNQIRGIVFTTIFVLGIATSGFSQTPADFADGMAKRSGQGIVDMLFSPVDVLNTMEDVRFREGVIPAITYGFIKGLGITTSRFVYGFYEVATFYLPDLEESPFPVNYDSALFRV